MQDLHEIPPFPQDRSANSPKPDKALAPATQIGQVFEQHIDQERHPQLPLHRIEAVAQEVTHLQGLFELAEKHFDLPPAAVELSHAAGCPLKVVG